MDGIKQYLLSVIVGAAICAILTKVVGKNTANAALVKLLSEVFLLILIISPFSKLRIPDIANFFTDRNNVDAVIADGELYKQKQLDRLIKESAEAYILDKAADLHADIQVEISLSETPPQIPDGVVIYGDVSPYTKTVLRSAITNDLGIPEEAQIWN